MTRTITIVDDSAVMREAVAIMPKGTGKPAIEATDDSAAPGKLTGDAAAEKRFEVQAADARAWMVRPCNSVQMLAVVSELVAAA